MPDTATTTPDIGAPEVSLSASAARRINKIVAGQPAGTMLRVEVIGGGCSGFSYQFTLEDAANDDDLRFEKSGVTLLVDPTSYEFLAGAVVDFVDDMMGSAFTVKNPNATSSCGCGSSFSV